MLVSQHHFSAPEIISLGLLLIHTSSPASWLTSVSQINSPSVALIVPPALKQDSATKQSWLNSYMCNLCPAHNPVI